jgi:hypothetical protein
METFLENSRKEVASEYPDSILSNPDQSYLYRDILNKELKEGDEIVVRVDWCNQDRFIVNYTQVSDRKHLDYKNYRRLSKEEFVNQFLESTKEFTIGTKNSIVDIYFAVGENDDLYYIYSRIRNDTNTMSKHKKNCAEGFLVYNPSDHGMDSDEPEEEAVEEDDSNSMGIPSSTPRERREQETMVNQLAVEESKKQELNNLIVRKIDDVISEAKKLAKRDELQSDQFSKLSQKYDEMETYIDGYIEHDLIQYETDMQSNPELKQKFEAFKKKWSTYFQPRIEKQYFFLIEKDSDVVPFLRKRNDFIVMLKELKNDINVNLFGKPAMLGGKTRRLRCNKSALRKNATKNKR